MGRNEFWDRKDINNATHTMIYNRRQLEKGINYVHKDGTDNFYRFWAAQAYVLYERDQVRRVRKVYSKPPRPPPLPSRPPIPVWKPEPITPEEVKAWEPVPLTWD
jgi:hypothetical protein